MEIYICKEAVEGTPSICTLAVAECVDKEGTPVFVATVSGSRSDTARLIESQPVKCSEITYYEIQIAGVSGVVPETD